MSLPAEFLTAAKALIPAERLIDDPLRTLAYGTDASFYRLIPKLVIKLESEAEVVAILQHAFRLKVAVTFRAAGTSLSGQAITDSVLLLLGRNWQQREVLADGKAIRLQPGVIGSHANQLLAPLARKIGPDPASINACKVGGIVANNASGMCCGTSQNSYQTLAAMRLVLADGTVLDTADSDSVARFRQQQSALLQQLKQLSDTARANQALAAKIRHKYRLKNTTGLSLNALLDFDDPIEMLSHLMVGSEGTLGFISSVTLKTVEEHPHKATALLVFPDVQSCCQAVTVLKQQAVSAVELLDRRSLRAVEQQAGMPAWVAGLSDLACALLIESRAEQADTLRQQLSDIRQALSPFVLEQQVDFSTDPTVYQQLWAIRKGTFPAVGAVRPVGSTVIIEDVTFPLELLAEGVQQLLQLFERYQYHEAIIFGHALEGNLHFVFTQRFDSREEVARYEAFMRDVAELVAVRCGGSLKAEHGTGRNMAPFVALEWGEDAYQLMWQIKHLLDPKGILNPDVVLSLDPEIHLKHLKPLPEADPLIDRCIECGFCEPVCPSNALTLTPRQRIVVQREIKRLSREEPTSPRLALLRDGYQYQGDQSCTTCGFCESACPVGINTGDLTNQLRSQVAKPSKLAIFAANHFAGMTRLARIGLRLQQSGRAVLGAAAMQRLSSTLHRLSGKRLPVWYPAMPGVSRNKANPVADEPLTPVVYFAACGSRVMGPAAGERDQRSLSEVTAAVLAKAGYRLVYPTGIDSLCCGMAFQSKGQLKLAQQKAAEVAAALKAASKNGELAIYCDTSPCSLTLKQQLPADLPLWDSIDFLHDRVLPKLSLTPQQEPVALHLTCSAARLKQQDKLTALVQACSSQPVQPLGIHCCGFAGDKGLLLPELNASALHGLRQQVQGCCLGVSSSRTCEIGLSQHSGIEYRHLVYLLAERLAATEKI
ncbi:FAD-binding and (Fe-S)-binding domain-containing protein [Alkalimonas sp.]|uniref:FAD-binding and (Fe-S)-binding domain-containing protein n=1 Tax=Alkalimonas sp. TaxID=1872453 RepID=UPI00263B9DF8|nr:FAD-binding and (Fe-S)-binding domain-containing protein [Alkalimonas sp.]MCC5827709.1 FAD-binding oxidoreductase [Alkalimonas sp.]